MSFSARKSLGEVLKVGGFLVIALSSLVSSASNAFHLFLRPFEYILVSLRGSSRFGLDGCASSLDHGRHWRTSLRLNSPLPLYTRSFTDYY